MKKRNVTISLDEDLARWARVRAAECDTSVSEMVAELLRSEMEHEEEAEQQRRRRAWERFAGIGPWPLSGGERYPSREEIYDRQALRRHERPGVQPG